MDREKQLADLANLILAGVSLSPQCVEGLLFDAFPLLLHRGPDCPICGETGNLLEVINHLGVDHRWNRERIVALLLWGGLSGKEDS